MEIGCTAKTTLKYWVYCLCVIAAFSLIGCRIIDNFQNEGETSGEISSAKLSLTGIILVPPEALSSMSANSESLRSALLAADLSGYVAAAGAEVWIEELPDFPHQITDKEGKYVFVGLNPGNYHVVSRIKKADSTLMKVRSPVVEILTSREVVTVPDLGLNTASKVVSGVLYGADGKFLPFGTVLTLWGEKFSVAENGQFTSPALPDDMVTADIVVAQPDVAAPSQPKVVVQFAPEGEATTVEVQVKAQENNYLPVIASLNAKKNGQLLSVDNQIRAADLINLSLNLTNIDRNFPGITFEWDEGRGRFSVAPGNNDSAVWVAPDTSGMATITVKVSAPDRGFFKVFLPVFVDQRIKAPTYIVAFDSQGGSAVSPQTVESGARVILPANPTRANYTFAGWYRDAALNSQWNFPTDTIATAVTLYARWIPSAVNTFTVTFDSQYGSPVTPQTVESGAKVLAPANPTRANYVFAGWYKDAAYTNQWNFLTDNVSATLTLYAKWTAEVAKTFTVNFDSQSGSIVPVQIVESGAKVREPNAPVRANYTFAGWFKNAAFTNLWNFDKDIVYGSVTLFAKWNALVVPTFTVSFNSQGGSAVASQTVASGAKVLEPAAPTRAGYNFAGWYKDAACTTLWAFSTDTVTTAVTLYAKWQAVIVDAETFTVSFNSQGGSAVASQTVASGAKALEPAAPNRAGYNFAGWYKDAACTTLWAFSTDTVTTAVTLYAKWQAVIVDAETFTVSFNSQGGSAVASQTVASGAKVLEPAAPTRAGYNFAGWYSDAALTVPWNFANDTVKAVVNLYAKWTIVQHTLTYTAGVNGSITGISPQTVDHGANGTLVTAVPAVGYKFMQWSDGIVTSSRTDTNVGSNITVTATFVAIDAIFAGANKYAWSENTGWVNFVPANGKIVAKLGANGHLSGMAWCENIGWVKFAADSAVAPFGNTSSTNWGVNLATDGKLSGFAWSENAGWINFGATNADATLNPATGVMSGSAWGENIGWVKFAGTQYGIQFEL